MTKNILRLYPAILIAAIGVGLLALLLSRFSMTAWIEPIPPDSVVTPSEPSPSPTTSGLTELRSPSPQPSPTATPLASAPATPTTPATAPPEETNTAVIQLGKLRVSNQTNQPVRVALLPLKSSSTSDATPSAEPPRPIYAEPVHWDFAPQEGSAKGLLLSLPDGDLQLQQGDILVAFAQDGSRRYWGPYVVGETPTPVWNADGSEWLLILTP